MSSVTKKSKNFYTYGYDLVPGSKRTGYDTAEGYYQNIRLSLSQFYKNNVSGAVSRPVS